MRVEIWSGPLDGLVINVDVRNAENGVVVIRSNDDKYFGVPIFTMDGSAYCNWNQAFPISETQIKADYP